MRIGQKSAHPHHYLLFILREKMKEKIGNIVISFPTYVAQVNDNGDFEIGKWDVVEREYLHLEFSDSFASAKQRARELNAEEDE